MRKAVKILGVIVMVFILLSITTEVYADNSVVQFSYPLKGFRVSGSLGQFIPNRSVEYKPGKWSNGAHLATDCTSSTGNWNVYPIYAGKVKSKNTALKDGAGRWLIIEHNVNGVTFYSEYQHLKSISVNVGDSVNPTTAMAVAGGSGTAENSYDRHLHFEIFTGKCTVWQSKQTQYKQNEIQVGPITINGTTYYNPVNVLTGRTPISGVNDIPASSFAFQNVAYPKTYYVNSPGGWYLGSGTLVCDRKLKTITTTITKASGEVVSGPKTHNISGYSYQVINLDTKDGSNNGVRFSYIKNAGDFVWTLTATDETGRELKLEMPFTAVTSGTTVNDTKSLPYNIPVESLRMNGSNYWIGYMNVGNSINFPPDIYPVDATNKELVFPVFNDGVISVSSDGTIHTVGRGWSGFTVHSADNPDASFVYTFIVSDYNEDNLPTWYPANLQVLPDGVISFDIVAQGSGAFNHFVLSFPGCRKIGSEAIQPGIVISGTDEYYDFFSADDMNMIQYGEIAHIELLPLNLQQNWGKVQNYNLRGEFKFGYYSVFPGVALYHIQEDIVPIGVVLPEVQYDFVTPPSLTAIEDEAFNGVAAKSIRITDNVTSIGNRAFANCSKLRSIHIPESCTFIASDALFGDYDLTVFGRNGSRAESFAIEKGYTFIPAYSLYERIRQHIMLGTDYKAYIAELDLDGNGEISVSDYVIARKAE